MRLIPKLAKIEAGSDMELFRIGFLRRVACVTESADHLRVASVQSGVQAQLAYVLPVAS